MLYDLCSYDHPALYLDLVERKACTRAWRRIKHRRKNRSCDKAYGSRRVRRVIKQYLRSDARPRIDSMAAGNSWEID